MLQSLIRPHVLRLSVIMALAIVSTAPLCRADDLTADDRAAITESKALRNSFTSDPALLIDGDPATELTTNGANSAFEITIDLGRPCVVDGLRVTNGQTNTSLWIAEAAVGPAADDLPALLGRPVNLLRRPGWVTTIPLPPTVGRYVQIRFAYAQDLSEIQILGRENRPERHYCAWWGDVEKDLRQPMDYFADDLGITDIWLDYVETAFPQTNNNFGLDQLAATGVLEEFRQRGIRYWLGEHEWFTQMVNAPEVLADELAWQTTFRQMRSVYRRARELGFTGIVADAEDYYNHHAWQHSEHWGPDGLYYKRGRQIGELLKEIWDCEIIQMWEGRIYGNFQFVGGKGYPLDYEKGNYWFCKGLSDAGIRVSFALEKTYGAGEGELAGHGQLEYLTRWFGHKPEFYVDLTGEAYPFAHRILPGFHPWNCRTKVPNYLPKYLDEQLTEAERLVPAFWIYTEGTPQGGDPRKRLDPAMLKEMGTTAEAYLDVFAKHPAPPRSAGADE